MSAKRLTWLSKLRDRRQKHGARGSPAASSQDIRLPEDAAPTASAPPPVQQATRNAHLTPAAPANPQGTSPSTSGGEGSGHRSSEGRDGKIGVVTPPGATERGEQVADRTQKSATEGTLWDKAYDALKKDEEDKHRSDRLAKYEDLLSRVLLRAKTDAPSAPHEEEDAAEVPNQFFPDDAITNREKLNRITDLGLEYMKDKKISATLLGHELALQDQVKNVAEAVGWAEDYVKDAVSGLPYASIICAGVALVLPLLKNPVAAEAANREGFTYVTSRIRYYAAMESLLLPKGMEPDLRDNLEEISWTCPSVLRFYRSRTKNYLRGTVNYDGWAKLLQDIKDSEVALLQKSKAVISHTGLRELMRLTQETEASRRVLEENLDRIVNQLQEMRRERQEQLRSQLAEKDHECLRYIRLTNPRDDKERIRDTKGGLLEDCYKWILDHPDFRRWKTDNESRLLWINGDAGKGKTMLLIGIIDELEKMRKPFDTGLLSFFFCQSTDKDVNNAMAVLRGLIYMLIVQEYRLISHLRTEYDRAGRLLEGNNAFYTLSAIFKAMLRDPLVTDAYLVVDALDECEGELPLLLRLIVETASAPSSRVKWIVSSRNRPEIKRQLDPNNTDVRLDLELNAQLVDHAIDVFITHKMDTLTSISHDQALQTDVREKMRREANGTFLWVALVFKELLEFEEVEYEDSSDILEVLGKMPSDLPGLYDRMMEQISRLKSNDPEYCRSVLSAVTLAYRPLHLRELPTLAGIGGRLAETDNLKRIINKCGSFLTIRGGYVYLIHQSAKEYLTMNAPNAPNTIFPAGQTPIHFNMFSRSLDALSKTLQKDIYKLCRPGFSINDIEVPNPDPLVAVRYSSVHWVDHLCEVEDQSSKLKMALSDDGAIWAFFKEHFLYWLESLSLLRKVPDAIPSIRKLLRIVDSTSGVDTELTAFLKDAEKYTLSYRSIIERAPLQIYGAALVFCPTATKIKRQFWKEQLQPIKAIAGIEDIWDPCLQTLEGHCGPVNAVAFSPDGTTLASASDDSTVRLWDMITGVHRQTLEGHERLVIAVAFSPDGTTLALADQGTVRLWDIKTGAYRQTLEANCDLVTAVAFSPDSTTLASVDKGTVQLWDTKTGAYRKTLKGYNEWVTAVAFSPDGTTLASASHDNTVRLWDVNTGVHQRTLTGHSLWVTSVAFSPDGTTLASASDDSTVRLWDMITGAYRQTLEGHNSLVTAVTFLLDGTTFASASDDSTVRLWDTKTGAHQRTLKGHSRWVTSFTVSPDGTTLASASHDNTVRLWDAITGAHRQTLKGHSAWVTAVAFSPNGTTLASASGDGTVRIWDAKTGVHWQTRTVGLPLRCLSFSDDGQYLEIDGKWLRISSSPNAPAAHLNHKPVFVVHDDWITQDGEKLLWLPPNYRATCTAAHGRMLVLGHASGGVTLLQIAAS